MDITADETPAAAADAFDVVIVGGGAAGLSAALTLARARRRVVVVDSGEPRNAPADGVHGFLTRDGVNPLELVAIGRAEVESYGGEIRSGRVVSARRVGESFEVAVEDALAPGDDGRMLVVGSRLLVTTGLVDELPDIPGLRDLWGRDVIHCPFCHGWEVRNEAVGIIATGPAALHQALLFRQWTDRVTLLLHGVPAPSAEDAEKLEARGIAVVDGPITELRLRDGRLSGVAMADGVTLELGALVVGPMVSARAGFLADIGLEATPHPMGVGTRIEVDATGRTAVPGVWAAGNVADPMQQVVMAAASGVTAGAAIVGDIMASQVDEAVADLRARAAVEV